MSKRWLNSPRIALGCLAAVAALSLAVNASAVTLRSGNSAPSTTPPAVFGPSPTTNTSADPIVATLPPGIFPFSFAATGLTTFSNPQSDCVAAGYPPATPASDCTLNPTHCNCVESAFTLSAGSGPFFQGPAVFIYNVDQDSRFNNGSQQCFAASGVLSITRPQGTIQFPTAGLACNGDSFEYSTFEGAFSVTGSGAFSEALGTGTISFSNNNTSGTFPGPFGSALTLIGAGGNLN